MWTYLYLIYEGGELAGLECTVEADDRGAAASASRMVAEDSTARCVEIWRDGRLIDLAGAGRRAA